MAKVYVDYSEFETLKNRVKELEETVKEKDKTIASLKDGSRVIIRKEVQIEYETFSEPYRRLRGIDKDPLYSQDDKPRRTVETSESYLGFEDVRLKVEDKMKDEINRSSETIHAIVTNPLFRNIKKKRKSWMTRKSLSMISMPKRKQLSFLNIRRRKKHLKQTI